MKFLKVFGSILFVLLVCLVAFYFWGRRSLVNENSYSAITTFTDVNTKMIRDTFSVMTFNIGYLSGMTNNLPVERPESLYDDNLKKTTGLLRDISPDIVAFQEIDFDSKRTHYVNQLERIGETSGYQYGAVSVNWDKQYVPFPYWPLRHHFGKMLSGQAIIAHAPILSNERIVLPKPLSNAFYYNDFYLDRLAQVVWVKTSNDSLLVINVHFEAWDGPTREIQAEMVLDIYQKYEHDHPIILMGDFNCNPPFDKDAYSEKTIDLFLSHPSISMANTKYDYLQNPSQHYTFDSEDPFVKIDYVFYNNRFLECLRYDVIQGAGDISDHLPVMAMFKRKQ